MWICTTLSHSKYIRRHSDQSVFFLLLLLINWYLKQINGWVDDSDGAARRSKNVYTLAKRVDLRLCRLQWSLAVGQLAKIREETTKDDLLNWLNGTLCDWWSNEFFFVIRFCCLWNRMVFMTEMPCVRISLNGINRKRCFFSCVPVLFIFRALEMKLNSLTWLKMTWNWKGETLTPEPTDGRKFSSETEKNLIPSGQYAITGHYASVFFVGYNIYWTWMVRPLQS